MNEEKSPHICSSFERCLDEDGLREEVQDLAQKRVLAWQLEQAMEETGVTKVEMARRMRTSSTQVERVFDPTTNKVQLDTLQRAARAVGRTLKLMLV